VLGPGHVQLGGIDVASGVLTSLRF
jgi:hypothetical protein